MSPHKFVGRGLLTIGVAITSAGLIGAASVPPSVPNVQVRDDLAR